MKRFFDFSRVNLNPQRGDIDAALRYWAAEIRALGLATLEGCTVDPLPSDSQQPKNR